MCQIHFCPCNSWASSSSRKGSSPQSCPYSILLIDTGRRKAKGQWRLICQRKEEPPWSSFANLTGFLVIMTLTSLCRCMTSNFQGLLCGGLQFSSVQLLSRVRLFATPWTAARQASLPITNSWSPPKPMSIELMMPSNHLILCRPLLLLPSVFPSIRVFSNESALCMRWPKYWSCSFKISPSNEHPGLISLRKDWFDLLAVQGTLKSLLQHHSSKASILQHSAFFIVQLSHPYMTTGKTIALTRWTFVGKVICCLGWS